MALEHCLAAVFGYPSSSQLHSADSNITQTLLVLHGLFLLLLLHNFLPRGKVRPADKLQSKAATILPFVGLARSKQDPLNRGHGACKLYRPLPVGA